MGNVQTAKNVLPVLADEVDPVYPVPCQRDGESCQWYHVRSVEGGQCFQLQAVLSPAHLPTVLRNLVTDHHQTRSVGPARPRTARNNHYQPYDASHDGATWNAVTEYSVHPLGEHSRLFVLQAGSSVRAFVLARHNDTVIQTIARGDFCPQTTDVLVRAGIRVPCLICQSRPREVRMCMPAALPPRMRQRLALDGALCGHRAMCVPCATAMMRHRGPKCVVCNRALDALRDLRMGWFRDPPREQSLEPDANWNNRASRRPQNVVTTPLEAVLAMWAGCAAGQPHPGAAQPGTGSGC